MNEISSLPQGTSKGFQHSENYGAEPTVITKQKHFLSRLAGTNHELALQNAESHDEITFLLNHANEIRPQFSGLLRRRLLRAAAIRRVEIQNARQNSVVLSEKTDSTRGKIYE